MKNLKRIIALMLCLAMAFSLFACGKTEEPDDTADSTENTEDTTENKENTGNEAGNVITSEILRDVEAGKNSNTIVALKNFVLENNINIFDIAVMSEKYDTEEFCPQFANACNDSYSVAKVYTLTAIGILVDEGKLKVDEPIYPYFEDIFPKGFDEKWKTVTVENVIAHKMGIAEGCLDIDTDYVRQNEFLTVLFKMPLTHEPGTTKVYSDGAYYLLSRLVAKVAGKDLDAFLMEKVFRPMHVQEAAWSTCAQGYSMGATGLYIRAKDITKLGYAYLNEGKYNNQQIFSADWAKFVLENGYELEKIADGVYCKIGMYGQGMIISENNNFSVAWHGYMFDEGYEKIKSFVVDLDKKITAGEVEF